MQKIATELVATPQEATAGQQFATVHLTQLFGSVPKGLDNAVAKRGPEKPAQGAGSASADKLKKLEEPLPTSSPPENPKTRGVPGGQGITIKGSPKEATEPNK